MESSATRRCPHGKACDDECLVCDLREISRQETVSGDPFCRAADLIESQAARIADLEKEVEHEQQIAVAILEIRRMIDADPLLSGHAARARIEKLEAALRSLRDKMDDMARESYDGNSLNPMTATFLDFGDIARSALDEQP